MLGLLLVLPLLGVCLAGDCQCEWKAPATGGGAYVSLYGLVSAKIDVQSVRIFQLERRLQTITDKLNQLRNRSTTSLASELENRLNKIQGTGCSPRQFACGGDTHDCVSDLMTCDGTADCANGADEDSKMCSTRVIVGSTWEGTHFSACDVRVGSSFHRITITGEYRSKYLPAVDRIKATMTIDLVDANGIAQTTTLEMTGQWSSAMNQLVLYPPSAHPLKVWLKCFPRPDYAVADCTIRKQVTYDLCGTATLALVSHH